MASKHETLLPEKRKNFFVRWILNHKLSSFLLLLLLVVFFWSLIKSAVRERHFESEKQKLISSYDSLNVTTMENTAKVFSWAIRGEMTRDNMEQVNQYFMHFIKGPNVNKILLIDPSKQKVILSTDKKDEGSLVSDTSILNAEDVFHRTDQTGTKIISPVMGLNSKMAVLVLEMKKPVAQGE